MVAYLYGIGRISCAIGRMEMRILARVLLGAGAAAAALVSTAAPAEAQSRYRDRDKISAGEVIAGAVILGGLAAVLSAGKKGSYQDEYDGSYNDGYSYNTNYGSRRAAISKCINRVDNQSGRYGGSNVTKIRSVERTRYGYRVQGILDGQNGYGSNDRYNRNGYGDGYNRGHDGGRFTCYVERGRVIDIGYNGSHRWN
ncbi:hypothetical protein [Haliscomenobacter sp.]|uniref:hypothetical protein n=1 Tax=Haliscomenobacter sp. TaxID=2717303 RepID=UPI0033651871